MKLVIVLASLFLPMVTLAHETGEVWMGSYIRQFLFVGALIVLGGLTTSAGVDLICKEPTHKQVGYLIVGTICLVALGYFAYHYFIH